MKQETILRKMIPEDYDSILVLVINTWDYRSWVPNNLVAPMADFFLSDLLLESDDVFVAQIGDDIVGIVATGLVDQTNIQKISTRKNISSLEKILRITEPDSIFLKYIQTLEINEFLLEKSQKNYDAGLNLLIVKEEFKGLGIGGLLYNHFYDYLKQHQAENFYLFTDNSSDYQYYEHKGLSRVAEKKYYWEPGNNDTLEIYYLYEGKLNLSD
ncbi:GNAT family N-acetyltransferase [Carnobacterium viridans]|uniref:N-acetyltransferase domain-containing protein n=1 Tax=Carnobacterium viridans TaxID=174587 RepID=A0A1H0XYP2_9LACT|nr:GNAT family N-acetyltransferase [Carnobacterium viridans]SDQ08032.1 hypothetical protein SAMN04487752_0584 [Carnobacterium viridans]